MSVKKDGFEINLPFSSYDDAKNENNKKDILKIVSFVILGLDAFLVLSYFTTLLSRMNLPDAVLFPIWFIIGFSGIVTGVILRIKNRLMILSFIMFILSAIVIVLGMFMRILLYM